MGPFTKPQAGRLKFHRQHPIGPYIVDFYCAQHKLAVELDGGVHLVRAAYDAQRTAFLAAQGIRLLRVNNELVENDVEMVLDRIATACGIVCPSPDLGEGQADGGGEIVIDDGYEP